MRTATLQIRTPEGVRFSQLLAGPVTRFLAWFIDALCITAIVMVVSRIALLLIVLGADVATAFNTLAYFAISIGYGIFCEWRFRGQTIGKRLFRLRVMDAEGLRLQFHQVVTRNLLRFVDMLPFFYFVGGVTALLNRSCQRLGDIAANTIVIRHPRLFEPDLDQLLAGKYNSLRDHAHLAARLRQHVTPVEAALAVQALIRRDQFDPIHRVELFEDLATHFKAKVQFPPEATDGITDEQFLRNVVDIVYRNPVEKRQQKAAA